MTANLAPTAGRFTPVTAGGPASAEIAGNARGAILGALSATDPNAGDSFTSSASAGRSEAAGGNVLKLESTLAHGENAFDSAAACAAAIGGVNGDGPAAILVGADNEASVGGNGGATHGVVWQADWLHAV